ncbi:tetratricopeptide repeat protein (plasmid) [Azospirillum sp. 412522]|nr:tetratricopeptide repeat protein [Azospirillum sp. 412522]
MRPQLCRMEGFLFPMSPAFVETYNAGVIALQAGRFDQAADIFRDLLSSHPDNPQIHCALGFTLKAAGRVAEAEAALRAALSHRSDLIDALSALGQILMDGGRNAEAEPVFRRLLQVRIDHPGASLALGNILLLLDRKPEAEGAYRLALMLEPGNGTVLNNLGAVRLSQGHPLDGAVHYRRSLVIASLPEYRKNLGTCLLMAGDFEGGTAAYEGRLDQAAWRRRNMPGVLWTGQPLAGKTLLVHFEQGLGDSFQFIRYATVLKGMGARVVYECQPALKRVLSTAPDVDHLVAFGEPLPPYDYHVSLMSLMHRLGTRTSTIPGGVPYLRAEPERMRAWGRRLGIVGDEGTGSVPISRDVLRIGINWHGNEAGKSIPLDCFAAMARLPGVRLYSLQKVSGLEQLDRLQGSFPLETLGPDYDGGSDAFVDAAAVMANMDLIITCDTSVCHLAGAMGRPVWVVLKWFADWRWMRDRQDSPWYPSMRLFRQARPNDWAEAMERVTASVAAFARNRNAFPPSGADRVA